MKSIIRYRLLCFFLALLMPILQACQNFRDNSENQNAAQKLVPFLIQPKDFTEISNWRDNQTSFGLENQETTSLVGWAYTILDGETESGLVYFEHDLKCYEKPPVLESPDRSNRTEIDLHILAFGDKSLSLCYRTLDDQIKGCIINLSLEFKV